MKADKAYSEGWADCEEESAKQLEQVNAEWQKNMELQRNLMIEKFIEVLLDLIASGDIKVQDPKRVIELVKTRC